MTFPGRLKAVAVATAAVIGAVLTLTVTDASAAVTSPKCNAGKKSGYTQIWRSAVKGNAELMVARKVVTRGAKVTVKATGTTYKGKAYYVYCAKVIRKKAAKGNAGFTSVRIEHGDDVLTQDTNPAYKRFAGPIYLRATADIRVVGEVAVTPNGTRTKIEQEFTATVPKDTAEKAIARDHKKKLAKAAAQKRAAKNRMGTNL